MPKLTPTLPEQEWNFDTVPDSELVACCYWEYARESEFIRNTLKGYRDWYQAGGRWSEVGEKLCKDLESFHGIGYVSEVFVRGCSFPPEELTQSENPEEPNYRHPQAPAVTGSFPTAWQSLAPEERRERAHIRSARTQIPLAPFKRGEWHDARDIAEWAEARWREVHSVYKQVRREDPETSEVDLIKQGKLQPFLGIQPSLYWEGGREVTVVSIQWADFTNEEIVQYFRRWVKANRPKRLGSPDARGHKPGDWRANLTRLAVMRLLSRFTALELVAEDKFPEIWKTKQFAGRKWGDVTKWHDARREAGKLFHLLFPFLPKDEKPLSWNRHAPAK